MTQNPSLNVILLTFAIAMITALLASAALRRTFFPPLVGFIALGFCLRIVDDSLVVLGDRGREIIEFMGKIGLVSLLFRVGLESDIQGLLAQIRRASLVLLSNVFFTGLAAFACIYYFTEIGLLPGLVVATALTATSVGVSLHVWEDSGALGTPRSDLLLDVAELDDISAIVFMAILFALLPALRGGEAAGSTTLVLTATGGILLKLVLFLTFLFLLARYCEHPMSRFLKKVEHKQDFTLTVAGIGFAIASLAGILGFSLAIGAFFAGLTFRRDPETPEIKRRFQPLYELFSPFFFISIGLSLSPGIMAETLWLGLGLFILAVLSKLVAIALPVWLMQGRSDALLLGTSMIPRAEISLVVIHKALALGTWAMTERIYGAMVLVSAATCLIPPVLVHLQLRRKD